MIQDLKLAEACNLPSEMLAVYLQLQMDCAGSIKSNNAKRVYHLSEEDLQTCKQNSQACRCSGPKRYNGCSKKHKFCRDGVPTHRYYNKQDTCVC